jgi:peptidyl-tRNA hydrolase, PTH1 family
MFALRKFLRKIGIRGGMKDSFEEENLTPSNASYLVVGLGNPGRQYKENRHNAGFILVDRLAARLDLSFTRVQFRALIADTRLNGIKVYLAKPQTYMNESGQAVGAMQRFFKIPLENILVAHDDVDLPFGTLRLRPGGGSAGQKGVASIIDRLGSPDFPRLRIGVGRPPGRMLAAAYVLQDFSKQEAELLPQVMENASEAALVFVKNGLEKAMNQYNGPVEEER